MSGCFSGNMDEVESSLILGTCDVEGCRITVAYRSSDAKFVWPISFSSFS